MATIDINVHTEVFNPVYLPYLDNTTRRQIYYGGASSGKSVFLAQRCVYDMLHGGRNYLICRQVARTLKTSVFAQVCRVISEWGVARLFAINKSEHIITCNNGYQIIFVGLDDTEKIKSVVPAIGAWTDIWVEEATETERSAIKQLSKRQRGGGNSTSKRLTLSFNPILRTHWIYEEYFNAVAWADDQTCYNGDDLSILKTTYSDNEFLTPDDVRDLQSETDTYFYSVYTLGNWGILGSVIFTNWSVADLSAMRPNFTNTRNGIDFGFSADPAALVRTHYDRSHKTIYVFDELYETGLTNQMLADMAMPIIGREPVICDSAEQKSIVELCGHGINARPARKGPDSVNFGVQWLQQQTIVIDNRCINTRNEFAQYQWREDASGRPMRQPTDRNNHLIDALRYAYEGDMIERRAARSYQG